MSNEDQGYCGFLPGPRLSLIFAAVLLVQTILNDPTSSFQAEIASQLGATSPVAVSAVPKSTDSNVGYIHKVDRRFHLVGAGESVNERGIVHLFRPSIWPYSDTTGEVSQNFTAEEASVSKSRSGRSTGGTTTLTDYKESVFVPLEKFMILDSKKKALVPRNNDGHPYASCRFMDYQYSFFFPHLAQQLFRCWAFWRAHSDKTPAFVITDDYHWKLAMDNEFNRGLINAIQHVGVQVFNMSNMSPSHPEQDKSISARSIGPILEPSGDHFQVTSTEDMFTFRQGVISSLNLTKALPPSFCRHSSRFPRIGIISRVDSRRIKNAKAIAEELKMNYNLTNDVPVVFFEGAIFRNQVGMMGSVDILITPHGAQETGVAFMPQCGGVLELLPDHYFFPRFYGTLATTVGLEHAYLYLAKNDSHRIVDTLQRDVSFLYPSVKSIQQGVDMLIERWQLCCDELIEREETKKHSLNSKGKK